MCAPKKVIELQLPLSSYHDIDDILRAIKHGSWSKNIFFTHESTLNMVFGSRGSTNGGHHGYDKFFTVSGLIRSPDSDHELRVGAALAQIEEGGLFAWLTAGFKRLLTSPRFVADYGGNNLLDEGIQNELSHLWGCNP